MSIGIRIHQLSEVAVPTPAKAAMAFGRQDSDRMYMESVCQQPLTLHLCAFHCGDLGRLEPKWGVLQPQGPGFVATYLEPKTLNKHQDPTKKGFWKSPCGEP